MNQVRSTPAVDPAPSATWKLVLGFVAFFAIAWILYAPCLDGEFVSDDIRFIAANQENLEDLARPWRFFLDADTIATPPDRDIYRPLRTGSFALDFEFFGATPRAFHFHNLILHALAATLLLAWLRGIAAVSRFAWFGATLFVVHPLATEAVAWISSRSDLQACVIGLAALLVARRVESKGGAAATVTLVALGFGAGLAKETAVVVPALYLVDVAARGRSLLPISRSFVALGLGTAAYLALYLAIRDRGVSGQVDWYGGSFVSHLPYAVLGLARQLQMLVAPARFNFIHEPALYRDHDFLTLGLATATLVAAIIGVVLLRRRAPGVASGACFYAIALLPAANVLLPLRSVLAERFAYFPLCGFALVGTAIAAAIAARLPGSSPAAFPGKLPRTIACLLVLVPAGVVTRSRAHDFSSARALYAATLEGWPDSYSAALGLGDAALGESKFEDAATGFLRAIEIARAAGDAKMLRRAEYALGRSRLLARDFVGASTILESVIAALESDPALFRELLHLDADARHALGTAYSLSFRLDLAARTYDRLIELHGETAPRLDARAEVERARAGDGNLALKLLRRAIQLDPDYAKARIHLAKIYYQITGFEGEAMRELREVLARNPYDREAKELLDAYTAEQAQRGR